VKKKAPKQDTSAQDAALALQRTQSAALDEEENRRRKRLLAAQAGTRGFAGSPMFRRATGNTAANPVASALSSGTSATYARASTGAGRGGRSQSMIP
jgi:hypothetical protein